MCTSSLPRGFDGLSVGSAIAFTGVFLAKVIGDFGLSPPLAFPLVLVMGRASGAFMGFPSTPWCSRRLSLLWPDVLLRGVSYLVSE
ncbi:hypothetical protein ACNKHM_08825 [Shigella sonnei]